MCRMLYRWVKVSVATGPHSERTPGSSHTFLNVAAPELYLGHGTYH